MLVTKISFSNSLNLLPFSRKSNNITFFGQKEDVFVKSQASSEKKDNEGKVDAFSRFMDWAKTNNPFKNISLEAVPYEDKDGISRFKLKGTKDWELSRCDAVPTVPTGRKKTSISKINQVLPETTTGGAIARVEIPYNEYFSQFYFVHSAPKGRRVSLPDSAINKENTEIFKQNLSELAKMPQEAYDDLADTIFHLSSHSYGFDSEDSGSILFSEDGKKLIVKNPKYSQDEKAPASNTLCTLLGGEYAINYFKTQGTKDKQNRPTDNELRDNINTVAIKYIDALGKKGYDFEKTKRLDKLLQTGILDEITNSSKSYPNFRLGNLKHLLKN